MAWIARLFGPVDRSSDDAPHIQPPRPPGIEIKTDLQAGLLPTVKFDATRVTDAVKANLAANIRGSKDFDDIHFKRVYQAAVTSISRGGDLAVLFNAIMVLDIPTMTKAKASAISLRLNNKATTLMNRDRRRALGLVISLSIGLHGAAHAQSIPTTRRLVILCASEDPSCGQMLRTFYEAAIKDPIWGGNRQICPPIRRGRPARFGDQMDPMTTQEIYHWFMGANAEDSAVWQYPARIGMLYALRNIWFCR